MIYSSVFKLLPYIFQFVYYFKNSRSYNLRSIYDVKSLHINQFIERFRENDFNARILVPFRFLMAKNLEPNNWILVKFFKKSKFIYRWVKIEINYDKKCVDIFVNSILYFNLKKHFGFDFQIDFSPCLFASNIKLIVNLFLIFNKANLLKSKRGICSLTPQFASEVKLSTIKSKETFNANFIQELLSSYFTESKYINLWDIILVPVPLHYQDKNYFKDVNTSFLYFIVTELKCIGNFLTEGCLVSIENTTLLLEGTVDYKVPYITNFLPLHDTRKTPPCLSKHFYEVENIFKLIECDCSRSKDYFRFNDKNLVNSSKKFLKRKNTENCNYGNENTVQTDSNCSKNIEIESSLIPFDNMRDIVNLSSQLLLIGPESSGTYQIVELIAEKFDYCLKILECMSLKGETSASTETKVKQIFNNIPSHCIICFKNISCLAKDSTGNEDFRPYLTLKQSIHEHLLKKSCNFIIGLADDIKQISDSLWSLFSHHYVMETPNRLERKDTILWLLEAYFQSSIDFKDCKLKHTYPNSNIVNYSQSNSINCMQNLENYCSDFQSTNQNCNSNLVNLSQFQSNSSLVNYNSPKSHNLQCKNYEAGLVDYNSENVNCNSKHENPNSKSVNHNSTEANYKLKNTNISAHFLDLFSDDRLLNMMSHRTSSFTYAGLEDLGLKIYQKIIEKEPSSNNLKNDVLKNDVLKNDVLKNDVLKNDVLKNDVLKNNVLKILDDIQSERSETLNLPQIPKVNWSQIGGLERAKKELVDTIQLPIKYPEIFAKGFRRSGIVMYGPPGSGKTLLAKAVASECGLNFMSVKGPELLDMYIGQSESNVREVFSKAKIAAPCIIFFDEIDALAPSRGRSGDSAGVMDRMVSTLLTELDSALNMDVFVLAATNRPDLLDPALLRPGRFEKQIFIGLCKSKNEKIELLKAVTSKMNLETDLNFEKIVDKIPANFTGADFASLASCAFYSASRRSIQKIESGELKENEINRIKVSQLDFVESISHMQPSITEQELLSYENLAYSR